MNWSDLKNGSSSFVVGDFVAMMGGELFGPRRVDVYKVEAVNSGHPTSIRRVGHFDKVQWVASSNSEQLVTDPRCHEEFHKPLAEYLMRDKEAMDCYAKLESQRGSN